MSSHTITGRKCAVVRLVKKSPEPQPETTSEAFIDLARKFLGLPSHASREDVLRGLNRHFTK